MDDNLLKNIENRLSAVIALLSFQTFSSPEEKEKLRPEVLLASAGLSNVEIAKILGKKLSAVQKTLQRSKK